MILQAQQELNLDLEFSILIGDKASDVQVGIAAGIGINILLAQSDPIELLGSVYHRISALGDALPFLTFAQSLAAEQ